MTIPLNIDTPTGQPYTVNKTVSVCSSGRVLMRFNEGELTVDIKQNGCIIQLRDAKRDVIFNISPSSLESFAYTALGKLAELKSKIK